MSLTDLQKQVEILYQRRGYFASPQTLTLGAMEELGELAQAVLLNECADFMPTEKKLNQVGDMAHEVGDLITYLLALCNSLGIEPCFEWSEAGDER